MLYDSIILKRYYNIICTKHTDTNIHHCNSQKLVFYRNWQLRIRLEVRRQGNTVEIAVTRFEICFILILIFLILNSKIEK